MIRWIRVVLPPWWIVFLAGFICFAFQAALLSLEWYDRAAFFSIRKEAGVIILGFVAFCTGLYAGYRGCAFHPALHPGYYQWLIGTPWTSRKPLPLGPIHLAWQDVLIVGVAVGLAWPRSQMQSLRVIQVFLFTYLMILGYAHYFTGQKMFAYAIAFGIGWMALFARNDPLLFFAVAGVTYVLVFVGLRASLAYFPWEDSPAVQAFHRALKAGLLSSKNPEADKRILGWPHGQLSPRNCRLPDFDLREKFLSGLLLGWWFFVATDIMQAAEPGNATHYLI